MKSMMQKTKNVMPRFTIKNLEVYPVLKKFMYYPSLPWVIQLSFGALNQLLNM